MKRFHIIFLVMIFLSIVIYSQTDTYRYGLFISSSRGYNEVVLTKAEERVKEMSLLFKEYCHVNDFQILADPDNLTLSQALEKARDVIDLRNKEYETQFFFFYYGHGLPTGLLLNNELFEKQELKLQIDLIKAKIKIVFLDACFAEVLGGENYFDFQTQSEGTVFITSSSLFEQSLSNVFTPILKTGLMGDADGFVPSTFAVNFFYDEIYSKLVPWDQEFIKEVYNFKENYEFLGVSPENEKKALRIFNSLGYENIPDHLDFTELRNNIFFNIKNSSERELIKSIYHFSDECKLKTGFSVEEKNRILVILEKIGFKQDDFVTLSELFAYIHARITQNKAIGQTPSINTSSLHKNDPVRLAYNDNKASILINYPGIVQVKRITGNDQVENILTIPPRMGDDSSCLVSLSPGKYMFLIEVDEIKYRVDKFIKNKNDTILLDESSWSSKIIYHEYPERRRNYLSFNGELAASLPVLYNNSLKPGFFTVFSLLYHFDTMWGILGAGIKVGLNYEETFDDVAYNFRHIEVPSFFCLDYISRFSNLYFIEIEAGLGYDFQLALYDDNSLNSDWGSRLFLTAGGGGGFNFASNMGLALKINIYSAFANFNNYFLSVYSGIEYKLRL